MGAGAGIGTGAALAGVAGLSLLPPPPHAAKAVAAKSAMTLPGSAVLFGSERGISGDACLGYRVVRSASGIGVDKACMSTRSVFARWVIAHLAMPAAHRDFGYITKAAATWLTCVLSGQCKAGCWWLSVVLQ